MNANLRQLRAFVAVYRLGSLTRAAEQMFITQPAVSVLIRQFEDIVGVRLFDRTTRLLSPTAAAHDAIERAERILQDFQQLTAGLQDIGKRRRGWLDFGATAAVASTLMPPVLRAFQQQFPEIDVRMRDLAPEQLVSAVANNEIEFSIGTPEGPSNDVVLATLLKDRIGVVCTRDSPLAARRQIAWSEIRSHTIVTVKKGSGIRTIIDRTLANIGQTLEPAHEVSYLSTALALTFHGLGVSILPSYLTRYFHGGHLTAVRLINPVVTRNLSIVTRRGSSVSPAAERFIEQMRAFVQDD